MKGIFSIFLILALVISLCGCSFGGSVTTDPTLDTTTPTGQTGSSPTAEQTQSTTQNQNSVPPSQRSGVLPNCIE